MNPGDAPAAPRPATPAERAQETRPAAPRAVVAWPPRRRDRVLGVPVGLLVSWQLAAVVALVGLDRPPREAALFAGAGLGAIGISALRLDRRWSYEWVVLWWRLRARRRGLRATPRSAGVDQWVLVRAVAGVRTVTEVPLPAVRPGGGWAPAEPAGERIGIVEHSGGLSAVIEIVGLSADMLELPISLLPAFDPDGPELALQAMLHVRPTPPVDWAGGALLTAVALPDPAWTPLQMQQAVTNGVARLLDRLRRQGYLASPVGAAPAAQMLRVLTMLDVAPYPDRAGSERWTRVSRGGVSHETLRLRTLSAPLTEVVRAALSALSTGTTVVLTARRAHRYSGYPSISESDRVVATQIHVRISETNGRRLTAAVKLLRRNLHAVRVKVDRMDGRQAPALAATLPLGVFGP